MVKKKIFLIGNKNYFDKKFINEKIAIIHNPNINLNIKSALNSVLELVETLENSCHVNFKLSLYMTKAFFVRLSTAELLPVINSYAISCIIGSSFSREEPM